MQKSIERFVSENQNGLYLIDIPTGIGKTTQAIEYIYNHIDEDRKFFYMQSSIPKASHLYKINVINNSKNIVKDLLDLMGVSFVKFNSFTVLPYSIKYLKEFAKIDY